MKFNDLDWICEFNIRFNDMVELYKPINNSLFSQKNYTIFRK